MPPTFAMCDAPVSVMPLQGKYSCSKPLLQYLRPLANALAPLGLSMFQPSLNTFNCLQQWTAKSKTQCWEARNTDRHVRFE
jgi:hypothetical protein